jgi:hypothetical protein
MKSLVFVHGRSQGGKDPLVLQHEWLEALRAGLAKSRKSLPPDVDVRFPFYGDVLDDLSSGEARARGETAPRSGMPDSDESRFALAILGEVRRARGITSAQVAEADPEGVIERGVLNWSSVQTLLRAIDRHVPGAPSKVLQAFTRDVYAYLRFPDVRASVNAIVAGAIPDSGAVVVAHSLGSVVAYDVLKGMPRSSGSVQLITVGSPLALRAIRSSLGPECYPGSTDSWFNGRDPNDVVALYPLSPPEFVVEPPISCKDEVDNHTENRHGISGYLDDPDVASRILSALS